MNPATNNLPRIGIAIIAGLLGLFAPVSLRSASPVPNSRPTATTVTSHTAASATETPAETRVRPEPKPALTPRNRTQHTVFASVSHLTNLSTLHFKASDEGSLNTGVNLTAGYNWTSRRGLGVGVIYSGGFASARRDAITRTSRLHYVAPEFVARQQAGRRWIFREAVGVGYGRYARSYGQTRASRGGPGLHERVSVECIITRWLGLSAEIGGQWLLVGAPDVDDGAELNLGGVLTFHAGGGVRFYF